MNQHISAGSIFPKHQLCTYQTIAKIAKLRTIFCCIIGFAKWGNSFAMLSTRYRVTANFGSFVSRRKKRKKKKENMSLFKIKYEWLVNRITEMVSFETYHISYSIYKHDAIDIADPSSMQDVCHMNFVLDLAHRSLCGSVVEHRNAETEGLRFDSSWGLRIFSLSYASDKTKNLFLHEWLLSHFPSERIPGVPWHELINNTFCAWVVINPKERSKNYFLPKKKSIQRHYTLPGDGGFPGGKTV